MSRIAVLVRQFWNDEHGVTAMEYALLGGLIAVVIVAAVGKVGSNLNVLYTDVATQLSNALSSIISNK